MNRPRNKKFQFNAVVILVILFVGVFLSLYAYRLILDFERQYIGQEFQSAADSYMIELRNGLDNNFFALHSIWDFFNAAKDVTREQFRSFTSSILEHYKTFHALEWVPRVPHAQRESYIELAIAEGVSNFEITEQAGPTFLVSAKARREYYPVFFVEPLKGNELDLGYDLASDRARYEAMARARDTGEISASSRISFIQDVTNEFGFVIFLPVYKPLDPDEELNRREDIIGYLTGVFRIDKMISHSMTYSSRYKVDIHIFDESAQEGQNFMYSSLLTDQQNLQPQNVSKEALQKDLHLTKSFNVGGRKWLVILTPKEEYIASLRSRWQPILVLTAGLMLTFLLAVYLIQFQSANQKLQDEIEQHQKTEDQLRASQKELRDLSAHLQEVREEERKGIAREIHDELGQALTALRMDISWMEGKLSSEDKKVTDKMQAMIKLIDSTIKSVQRISSELRPGILDDLGLIAALEWQIDDFSERMGIKCYLTIEPKDINLNAEYSTTIFRLVQETLTNVARHAQASEVNVGLKTNDQEIQLIIEDNGKGISDKDIRHPSSFGLMGMRERVHYLSGSIKIGGKPKKGTKVTISLPYEASRIHGRDA